MSNFKSSSFLVVIALGLAFATCSKSDNPTPPDPPPPPPPPAKSSEAKLLTFDFKTATNTGLSSEVQGVISEANKTIVLTVPPNTQQTNFVATFTSSPKSTVKVGTATQISGTTANNFSSPVSYQVIAEDSTVVNYTVSVIDPASRVKSISLQSNTQLMIADGISKPTLTVKLLDANGVVVPNIPYQLFANNVQVASNTFTTTLDGSYVLSAKLNNLESNQITIQSRKNIQYTTITVPVIFHVVHFGEAIGSGTNLTSTQVSNLLDKLNQGFSNQSNSVDPNAVDTKIRFRLAVRNKDNSLLPEPGISRANGTPFDIGSQIGGIDIANDKKLGPNESWELVKTINFNPSEYLNIWLYPDQEGRGSATLPYTFVSQPLAGLSTVPDNFVFTPNNPWIEGPFLSCKVNTASAAGQIVHEVGHVLGLLHPMSTNNCVTSDFCPDTYSYVYNTPTQPCSDNKGTLTSETVMDYMGTFKIFTYDQRERIRFVFNYALWMKDLKNSNK
jgi:hypothetical protein